MEKQTGRVLQSVYMTFKDRKAGKTKETLGSMVDLAHR